MLHLPYTPAVFAVGDTYQILVPVTVPTLMWVQVGDRCYYDDSNGILRSDTTLHRVTLPMKALDEAKAYTLHLRPVICRKPYFTECGEVQSYTYSFRPVPCGRAAAFHIADAHNRTASPIEAARKFAEKVGGIDFLIMNGDIPDHSGTIENFVNIFAIADGITKGELPIIFSRGNHDTRGVCAEKLADYTPTKEGRSYYTFRLGSIWGILLDCGEDKPDDHAEYGHTVCCEDFRRRQSDFLRDVVGTGEYNAPGISHRIVISHMPFTRARSAPFDIEAERFTEWASMLKEHIHPDVMICGHMHTLEVQYPGDKNDAYGHPCPVVIGSRPGKDSYAGSGFIFTERSIAISFTASDDAEMPEGCLLS